jgi:hypothetical protein
MDPQHEPSRRKPSPSNDYLRYSSLGLQLLASIGMAGYLGHLLDKKLGIQFPAFMLLFGFGVFAGMIYKLATQKDL